MKKRILKTIKLILIFSLFLYINLILVPFNQDEVWSYGFSLSIFKGLIPYIDFNMIIPPLYPYLMTIPFYILNDNEIIFQISNSIILTITIFYLEKIIGKNYIIIILLLIFPMLITYPNYNILLFGLFVYLLYLEKENKSDLLIGIILGLLVLTKQTVGLFISIVGIFYYIKDNKKFIKRIIGFIIVNIVFLIYLIINNNLYKFFDYCLFGLIEFTNNSHILNINQIVLLIITIITLSLIKKSNNKLFIFYTLAFYTIAIPLYDLYHLMFSIIGFVILIFLNNNKLNLNKYIYYLTIIFIINIILLEKIYLPSGKYINNINKFKYRYIENYIIKNNNSIKEYLNKNKDRNIIFLCSDAYLYKIANNIKITKYDLINKGNMGRNGNNKIIDSIKEIEKPIFIIENLKYSNSKQIDIKIINYIKNNYEKKDNILGYDVYE